ncbi:MAG: S8 family serine peptidase [Actinobacteria bacterium]|nr:S8 family serine peptidase [Actinomycetota bacterium]
MTSAACPLFQHRALWALAALVLALLAPAAAAGEEPALSIRPEVADSLAAATPGDAVVVLVTGESTELALAAVEAAGLTPVEVLDRLAVVAAAGSPEAVRALHAQPGVRRVDANVPLVFHDDVAHRATGVSQLRDTAAYPGLHAQRRPDATPYDGSGVSIAMVDSGFDTLHEQFVEDGVSKFDVHLRQACPLPREFVDYLAGNDPSPDACTVWLPAPPVDLSGTGHGTITAGVAAAYPRTTPSGARISGTAPGARLVGLSVGASIAMLNAVSALHWVLEHHADPCGDGSCPPIRVVNNSWGLPSEDPDLGGPRLFDPDSPLSKATTALIEAGVVVVWSAGNWGGDGTTVRTNVQALHPLPGMLGVGSFYEGKAGDRDAAVSAFSSRGLRGDPSTYPDLVAPGHHHLIGCAPTSQHCNATEVLSISEVRDGPAYGTFSGTSLSAPYVAGVVAQLLEANPSLTPGEVEDILEDTAHQRFIDAALLEPDGYTDTTGQLRSNDDHLTSYHAGHGLVDAVAAISRALKRGSRPAPDACQGEPSEIVISDPRGDTKVAGTVALEKPEHDVVSVTASMLANPGAFTVVVAYDDLPAQSLGAYTTLEVAVDGSSGEFDFLRDAEGERFRWARPSSLHAEAFVDPDADTITFVFRWSDGLIQRASAWILTAEGRSASNRDYTAGTCAVWLP